MTLPYIKCPASLTSLSTMKEKSLIKERNTFLKTLRRELKAKILIERASRVKLLHQGALQTKCPICQNLVSDGSMHEWLITRGDVRGSPFEWQLQIYVPWNVVIVHEGQCHRAAQWGLSGMLACMRDITPHYTQAEVLTWLDNISSMITAASEVRHWVEEAWNHAE